MTITLLAPDGVQITAKQERQAKAAQHGAGADRRLGGRSGFRVDTPSTVLTATSTTWTLAPCSAMIDPGTVAYQGMYGWSSDANITGNVTAADATNPRKDIVFIRLNDSSAGDGTSGTPSAAPEYLAGPADGTNVPPALPPRSFLVGTINVPVAGGGSPTVTLNPARFAAAGGILPVTDPEALTLVQSKGLTVAYPDGMTATSDGTSFVERADSVLLAPPDSGWTVVGGLVRTRTHAGLSMVTMSTRVTRTASGGNFPIGPGFQTLLAGFVPSGWRPTIVTDMRAVVNDASGSGSPAYEPVARVGTDGTGALRPAQGYAAVTGGANWTIHLQGSWFK